MNGVPQFKAYFYVRSIDKMLCGYDVILTHSDLQRKNILVSEVQSCARHCGRSFEVYLVDWEAAGWYPSYWESFTAFLAHNSFEDDGVRGLGHCRALACRNRCDANDLSRPNVLTELVIASCHHLK